MKAQKRAKAGGEFGANGEWYEGGKFINTIAKNDKRHGSDNKKATRKQEVAPYKWEVPPAENMSSIFQLFGGRYMTRENTANVPFCEYQGADPEKVQAVIDRYVAGEKWISIDEFNALHNIEEFDALHS